LMADDRHRCRYDGRQLFGERHELICPDI
jgi:hypothetical protein